MAAVQQRVLNWLYSVLTGQYQDVDRTYNDTAQALSHYSSLSPKTEVYTYENGTSALLLQLSGTIPVSFRGATYRFPVTIWIPQQYPRVEPMIYVTPSDGLIVRAGQHVDPQGRVYHPYLARWADHSDKSNVLDFLAILRDIFAKEPPVVSRQPQALPISSPRPQSIPPPVPPLPPDIARPSPLPATPSGPQPPPPPPKPHAAHSPQSHSQPPSRTYSGPPLPPLPPSHAASPRGLVPPYPPPQQQQQFPGVHNQHAPARQSGLRYESAPPLPPQPQQSPYQQDYRGQPPLPYAQSPTQPQQFGQPQPPHQRTGSYGQPPQTQPPYGAQGQQQPPWHQQQQQPVPYQQSQAWQQPPQPPQPQPKPKAPMPDLLDDSPALSPPLSSNMPVPPVPRNPEKDALLHQIALRLYEIRKAEAEKHSTTLQSLAAQRDALNNALHNLQQESSQLSALQATLTSNTAALNQSLAQADQLIQKIPSLTPPSIDDLLVAPTVVANQLYDLVAEEKAIGDAIFNLGRAVEKGRIEPQVFVKMVRGLGRELFGKKMLIRKCAKGMGLSDGREVGY